MVLDIKTCPVNRGQGEGRKCFNLVVDHVFQRCDCWKASDPFPIPLSLEMQIHAAPASLDHKWMVKLRDGFVETTNGEISWSCIEGAPQAMYARWNLNGTY